MKMLRNCLVVGATVLSSVLWATPVSEKWAKSFEDAAVPALAEIEEKFEDGTYDCYYAPFNGSIRKASASFELIEGVIMKVTNSGRFGYVYEEGAWIKQSGSYTNFLRKNPERDVLYIEHALERETKDTVKSETNPDKYFAMGYQVCLASE